MGLNESSPSDLKSYYDENGYVVVRGGVAKDLADRLISTYERDIKPSTKKFFRQNTNRYEANQISAGGYVSNSFLDIHNYKQFPEFRAAALDILFSPSLLDAVSRVTGFTANNLMQSMLFDANAETVPHQDWWYLDSVPAGNLLGCWIALENINEDAGRFFVLPKSHHLALHEKDLPHREWLERIATYTSSRSGDMAAPALSKGDVLIWNSRTVHGALKTRNGQYSRKSMTAHFMPSGMTFGNLFTEKPWVKYESFGEHKYFANQPEYSRRAEMISLIKHALSNHPRLLRIARKFQNGSVADAS